jgi:hypothetical protein
MAIAAKLECLKGENLGWDSTTAAIRAKIEFGIVHET